MGCPHGEVRASFDILTWHSHTGLVKLLLSHHIPKLHLQVLIVGLPGVGSWGGSTPLSSFLRLSLVLTLDVEHCPSIARRISTSRDFIRDGDATR